MKRTGHPEPLVREVLDGAGRWLDEVATTLAQRREAQAKMAGMTMSRRRIGVRACG